MEARPRMEPVDLLIVETPYIAVMRSRHEQLLWRIEADSPEWMFASITSWEKELSLFFANYKCECCSTQTDLTLHHLVLRSNRVALGFNKYFRRRHTTGNLSILCLSCHAKAEARTYSPNPVEKRAVISTRTIELFKRRAFSNSSNSNGRKNEGCEVRR